MCFFLQKLIKNRNVTLGKKLNLKKNLMGQILIVNQKHLKQQRALSFTYSVKSMI